MSSYVVLDRHAKIISVVLIMILYFIIVFIIFRICMSINSELIEAKNTDPSINNYVYIIIYS